MRRIAIFHFNPVDLFPPAMNLVNFLADQGGDSISIRLYTRNPPPGTAKFSRQDGAKVTIRRRGGSRTGGGKLMRYADYFRYYILSLIDCYFWRPHKILYFETSSSLPPYIIKKMLRSGSDLYIHYHEYMTPGEYREVPMLDWLHRKEKKLYKYARWISHTNAERMRLFLKDIGRQAEDLPVHIIPNFPPSSWKREPKHPPGSTDGGLRFVYVGAVDLESMYTREFAEWVEGQQGKCSWDIYSHQPTEKLAAYFASLGSRHIHIKGQVNYFDLPRILSGYDIGLILYKGTSLNFVHNAPNKLFEYLACDLDVWLPVSLEGARPYLRENMFPKVISLDFTKLQQVSAERLFNRKGLLHSPAGYFCETAFAELGDRLLNQR